MKQAQRCRSRLLPKAILNWPQRFATFDANVQTGVARRESLSGHAKHGPLVVTGMRVARRVLVVDDEAMIRAVLGRMLKRLEVDYELVADGSAAVSAAASARYDLVLMDINMPGLGGIEATRAILAAHEDGPPPVVVGMTGGLGQTLEQECRQAGMEAIFEKPLTTENLVHFLRLDALV